MGEAADSGDDVLVGLERELATYTIAGELAAGTSLTEPERFWSFVSPFRILALDEEVAWRYGQSYRYLKEQGLLIGTNDLWIAASALAHDVPIATCIRRHYGRVPGLKLASYRGSTPSGGP